MELKLLLQYSTLNHQDATLHSASQGDLTEEKVEARRASTDLPPQSHTRGSGGTHCFPKCGKLFMALSNAGSHCEKLSLLISLSNCFGQ